MDTLIESDEHPGFTTVYIANGAPYGITYDEMDEIKDDIMNEIPEKDNLELPF